MKRTTMQSRQRSALLGITVIATFGFTVLWLRQTSEADLRRIRTQMLPINSYNSVLSSDFETLTSPPKSNATSPSKFPTSSSIAKVLTSSFTILPSTNVSKESSTTTSFGPKKSSVVPSPTKPAKFLALSISTKLPPKITSHRLFEVPATNIPMATEKLIVFPPTTKPRLSKLIVKRLLPFKHWIHRRFYPQRYNQISCTNFPRYKDIQYAAASWQHMELPGGNIYLYGAYWDARFEEPVVRVLIYSDIKPLPNLVCQFWYEDENHPTSVPSTSIYGWRNEWGGPYDGVNEPYVLTCNARRRPPYLQTAPHAVSIVKAGRLCGTPSNVLNVQGVPDPYAPPKPPLRSMGVCLKWLQFEEDISAELVEWMELLKAFGVDKVYIFDVRSHPNTRLVLDYYTETGFADVTQLVHPPQLRTNFSSWQQNFHDYRRELMPLNDCMYRFIGKYQWLIPIDLDELIVPYGPYHTWQEMLIEDLKNKGPIDEITYQNYYFLDAAQKNLAAPPYMKKLGHFWRTKWPEPASHNIKGFHNTSTVITMHNHFPIFCGNHQGNLRDCYTVAAHVRIGRLCHYRRKCGNGGDDCQAMHDIIMDDNMKKWKHVRNIVDELLTELQIKPEVLNT